MRIRTVLALFALVGATASAQTISGSISGTIIIVWVLTGLGFSDPLAPTWLAMLSLSPISTTPTSSQIKKVVGPTALSIGVLFRFHLLSR